MKNRIVKEGIYNFPENKKLLERKETAHEFLIDSPERYHGEERIGCLLVKSRKEEVYKEHYLDIYVCLTHMKEACRCGWEYGFHYNEVSKELE